MKRGLLFLLTGLLLLCGAALNFAQADDDVYGSTAERISFFVQVTEPGQSITLDSSKGLAVVDQYATKLGLIKLGTVKESHYGFYRVTVRTVGRYGEKYYHWVPSATTNTDGADCALSPQLTLHFSETATYEVIVTPLNRESIDDYWKSDRLDSWYRDATWRVSGHSGGCEVFWTEPPDFRDNVRVTNYVDSRFYNTYTLSLSRSQYVEPQPLDYCTFISTRQYVTVDPLTGKASPSTVEYYFQSIKDLPTQDQGTSSTPTITPPPPPWPAPSLSGLPVLSAIGDERVESNGSVEVYTGPGAHYYRSASGKAAVDGGEWVTIYGRTEDWLLIQYSAVISSKNLAITRFAFIPANRIDRGGKYVELQLASVPIRIQEGVELVDEPSTTHYYNSFSSIQYHNAVALAQIIKDGERWIYFESTATSSQGTLPFRGFVQERYVSLR